MFPEQNSSLCAAFCKTVHSCVRADAGKPAHWVLAWDNSAGERGHLSVVSTWTIPG